MRTQGATFFLLDGRTGWRTARSESVSVAERSGLRLAARNGGPLALMSEEGSLGGVVLPLGMAFDDEGTLYLLGQTRPGVRRFDAEKKGFAPLAGVGEKFGGGVRQFYEQFSQRSNPLPSNIAIAGHNLYVADRGNRRVQVFALGTLALRHVWGPRDAEGKRTSARNPRAWEPVDVAAQGGRAYILDRRYGRVYLHRPGTDTLKLLVQRPGSGNRWTRIAVDRDGRIYLLNPAAERVEIYDRAGRFEETKKDAGDIRDRFDQPPLRLHRRDAQESWRFCLPGSLMRLCDRRAPFAPPAPESPLSSCSAPASGGLLFDREGERFRLVPEQRTGPKLYAEGGEWLSEALDSETYQCQWHRIVLDLYELPAGTRVDVYTYTDAEKLTTDEVKQRPDKLWSKAYGVAGQIASPPKVENEGNSQRSENRKCGAQGIEQGDACDESQNRHEFLVQSLEGQFLWLKILFISDGYGTPAIRSVRVQYPRESYLSYLPALFSADDDSRRFLERFLSIFQTEWDALEERIGAIAALFDPQAVPAGPLLEYLASWFALPLEGNWNMEQRRRLLVAATKIYFGRWKVTGARDECLTEVEPERAARRGTTDGLRRYLQVYLQNITGISIEEQGDYPQIIEGWRERRRLMLSSKGTAMLSGVAPLWSPSAVGRLHLGEFARESESRLVSTGDPEHEIFQEFAHRFRVFVPSSWVQTVKDEEMVRRALGEEKPGHTSYDLCLVEPRFRVGLQSTIGVDTIIGARPVARLACTHDLDVPPSRSPRQCLGYDTILAASTGDHPTMQVGSLTRAGIDTLLN
jgi:phage tail-like protein